MSGHVCVSIYGRDLTDLRNNFTLAQTFGPGFVELRLDYLRSPLQKITQLTQFSRLPNTIFTFRSRSEGGVARVSEEIRKQILLEIISEIAPTMIDIELKTLNAFPSLLDSLSRSSSRHTRLVASSHDFQQMEDLRELETLIETAKTLYSPEIIKVVRPAKDFQDNTKILSLYRLAGKIKPSKLVAFCVGQLGTFSRIACVSFGSPFTYAALPNKLTAPGQLDIQPMKTLLDSWEMKRK